MKRRLLLLVPVVVLLTASGCSSTTGEVCVAAQTGLDNLAIVGQANQLDTDSREWELAISAFRRMARAGSDEGHPRLEEVTGEALEQYLLADSAEDPEVRRQALVDGEDWLERVARDCQLAGLPLEFSRQPQD